MDASVGLAGLNREAPRSPVLLAMLLVSLGAMVVEISLTRVFSLVLFYHYTFLVIGLAMLGLAVGGLLAWHQCQRKSLSSGRIARWGTLSGLAASTATVLLVLAGPAGGLPAYTILATLLRHGGGDNGGRSHPLLQVLGTTLRRRPGWRCKGISPVHTASGLVEVAQARSPIAAQADLP